MEGKINNPSITVLYHFCPNFIDFNGTKTTTIQTWRALVQTSKLGLIDLNPSSNDARKIIYFVQSRLNDSYPNFQKRWRLGKTSIFAIHHTLYLSNFLTSLPMDLKWCSKKQKCKTKSVMFEKKWGFFFSYTHIKKSSTKIVVLILILVLQYKSQDLPFLSL